jgi:hypothetical protein
VLEDAMETMTGVRPKWYVLVTSASGKRVFATMGPYRNEAAAKTAAGAARVVHYRVGRSQYNRQAWGAASSTSWGTVGPTADASDVRHAGALDDDVHVLDTAR